MKNSVRCGFLSNRYLVVAVCMVLTSVIVHTTSVILPVLFRDDTRASKTIIQPTVIPTLSSTPESTPTPTPTPTSTPEPTIVPDKASDYILAPVIYEISTDRNVVFLGIDDGAFKDQSVIDIMRENNIKASLFLSEAFIASNPDFFKQLVDIGSVIENHTLSHDINMIKNQSYEQQVNEICGMADYIAEHYGSRPTLFRPPGGAYSGTMRRAAADCGMKAVVTWVAKANGGSMQYQIGDKLRPGDIVLMHFRPEFAQDMQAFIDAMNAAGLHTALIEGAI